MRLQSQKTVYTAKIHMSLIDHEYSYICSYLDSSLWLTFLNHQIYMLDHKNLITQATKIRMSDHKVFSITNHISSHKKSYHMPNSYVAYGVPCTNWNRLTNHEIKSLVWIPKGHASIQCNHIKLEQLVHKCMQRSKSQQKNWTQESKRDKRLQLITPVDLAKWVVEVRIPQRNIPDIGDIGGLSDR